MGGKLTPLQRLYRHAMQKQVLSGCLKAGALAMNGQCSSSQAANCLLDSLQPTRCDVCCKTCLMNSSSSVVTQKCYTLPLLTTQREDLCDLHPKTSKECNSQGLA